MSDLTDDELASAYLDGEVTADERARVEGDPALVARVARLGAARDGLAAAPLEPPDEAAREAAIRAAVESSGATIIDLRRERVRRGVRLASIAAAVLLVVGAAGLLIRLASNSSSSTKSSTAAANSVPSASSASSAAGGALPTAESTTAGPDLSVGSLGSFTDEASLAAAAKGALGTSEQSKRAASATTTTPGSFTAADQAAPNAPTAPACGSARSDVVNQLLTTTALFDGRAVLVDVVTLRDDSIVLVVRDATTCGEVFSQPL
jgi:cytoskeletal protein RodZ